MSPLCDPAVEVESFIEYSFPTDRPGPFVQLREKTTAISVTARVPLCKPIIINVNL